MGLFGNKNKGTARAMFYDGNLQGFTANTPCTFRVENDALLISRINPAVQVSLPLDRLKTAEVMAEADYMRLHKGTEAAAGKIPRWALRLAYTAQDGTEKALTFWFVPQEYKAVTEFVERIKPAAPSAYTL